MPDTLRERCASRIVEQHADRQLHHIAVDQPDEAELFGDRHEMRRGDHRAVGIGHAQQCLMHDDVAASRIDDRLIGELEAVLLEAGDDLGGAARIEVALRDAPRRRLEQDEAVGRQSLGLGQRLFGARHGGIGLVGMAAARRRRRSTASPRPARAPSR